MKCRYAIREHVPFTILTLFSCTASLFLKRFSHKSCATHIAEFLDFHRLAMFVLKAKRMFRFVLDVSAATWKINSQSPRHYFLFCSASLFAALPLLLLINNFLLSVLVLFIFFFCYPHFDYDRLTGFYAWSATVNVSARCIRPLEKISTYWNCCGSFTIKIDRCVWWILEKILYLHCERKLNQQDILSPVNKGESTFFFSFVEEIIHNRTWRAYFSSLNKIFFI